jgi:uncharacterized radical SAM superfamily Fe-S cluster-containing enzyme
VVSFIDRYNFDMRSQQKECIHFLTPDLRKIPFSAYNMFYRQAYRRKEAFDFPLGESSEKLIPEPSQS